MMGERSDVPVPHSEYTLHVVMVGTEHPGNLGAVCRSLLNHGFDSLRLVQPKCHPDDIEARNRAKHAGRVLDSCKIYDSFEQAVADCSLVVGTSGKREIGEKTQKRHFMYPWEFAERIESTQQSVALVFGEEGKGLSTEDLLRCDYLVTLPTWEGYPITNLSHAVHTLTYELHRNRVLALQGKDKAAVLKEMRIARYPLYRQVADIEIPVDNRPGKKMMDSILKRLNRKGLISDDG